jgi:hypothetical protein
MKAEYAVTMMLLHQSLPDLSRSYKKLQVKGWNNDFNIDEVLEGLYFGSG